MINEEKFRGFSITTMLRQLTDAKKHNFCNYYIVETINYIVVKLISEQDDKVIKLIQSDDVETFYLGIQMMFKDYLDLYNELCENPRWERLVSDTVRNHKFYTLNGNKTI